MEVVICSSEQQIAAIAADVFETLLRTSTNPVLGVATGSSPVLIYDELVRRHVEKGLSFAHAKAFMLDEYVGLPIDHPERYRNVIERQLASRLDFAPGAVQGPDGNAVDLPAACGAYEEMIVDAGGVDVQLLGIGTDGHIAFNEPASSLASRTRVKMLTEQTRVDNARFFDSLEQVPHYCVTQGLGTIMDAAHLLLVANGPAKAEAVAQLVEGPISAMWPATVMQWHPHVTVLLDEAAAAGLRLADYYRDAFTNKPSWQGL